MLKHALLATALLLSLASAVRANHGPGTSGGGSATVSGETLPQGKWDLALREDYTNFQNINVAHAERLAAVHGGFDAIQESYITSLGASYGITDDLQLGLNIGYYKG